MGGVEGRGKTGLTVTYADVTGHSASPRYRLPHGQASAEFRGAVTSHPWHGSLAAHCTTSGAAEVRVALTSTAQCQHSSDGGEGTPEEWGEWRGQVPGGWEWPHCPEGAQGAWGAALG